MATPKEEKVMDEKRTVGGGEVPVHGVLVVEGVETGDRRRFAEGALTWRELPLPLLWQKASAERHGGSTSVGRIERIYRDESGSLAWSGFMNSTAEADEVTGLVGDRSLRGVSVDVDDATMELQSRSGAALSEDVDIDPTDVVETLTKARISAATICAIPAFAEAYIALGSGTRPEGEREEVAVEHKEVTDGYSAETFSGDAVAAKSVQEIVQSLPVDPEVVEQLLAADEADLPDAVASVAESIEDPETAEQVRAAADQIRDLLSPTGAMAEESAPEGTSDFGPTSNPTTRDGPGWLTDPVPTQRLRNYWTKGEGAAKIDWLTPGDFNRCRTFLAEYVKPQHLSGTCANLHKVATGVWPGQHSVAPSATPLVRSSSLLAAAAPALERAGVQSIGFGEAVAVAADGPGGKPTLEVLSPGHRLKVLGVDAGTYSAEVVEVQSFRDGAVYTLEGEDVRGGSLPAAVAVRVQGSGPDEALSAAADSGVEVRLVGQARLTGSQDSPVVALAHALAEPTGDAFSEASLTASAGTDIGCWNIHVPSVYESGQPVAPAYRLVASGGPNLPPMDWFANPGLQEPTPLTITEDGQVFGHVATWGTCHVGFEDSCVTAPMSTSEYAYFCSGVVATDGGDVRAGQITFDTGHAGLELNSRRTMAHYDNTGHCAADVMAGEDEVGIWVAGAVRPGVTDEQMRTLRGAKMSGDWRSIGGSLEMVAVLAVNVPGFPIPRPALAASAGRSEALVAAGVVPETKGVENFSVEEVVSATLAKIEADRAAREEIQRISASLAAEDIERTVSSVQMEG